MWTLLSRVYPPLRQVSSFSGPLQSIPLSEQGDVTQGVYGVGWSGADEVGIGMLAPIEEGRGGNFALTISDMDDSTYQRYKSATAMSMAILNSGTVLHVYVSQLLSGMPAELIQLSYSISGASSEFTRPTFGLRPGAAVYPFLYDRSYAVAHNMSF
jgi:hypothetical protein